MADADGTPAEPEREPLTAAPCAWLTTLRRDGSAHVTPVWFLHDPGTFWIASSTVNVKVANIRRDPRVVLAIDGSGPRPVVAQGRARVHHDIGSYPTLLAPREDGPRVLLEVQVDRWLLGPGTAR